MSQQSKITLRQAIDTSEFAFFLLYSVMEALISIEIHRNAFYRPLSSQTFIENVSLPSDASMQSCICQCVHHRDCQTAVYFEDAQHCSMFSEFCGIGTPEPSGIERANVICYRKHHISTTIQTTSTIESTTNGITTAESKIQTTSSTRTTTDGINVLETTTSEPIRPIAYSPVGLYPLNISSCATWQGNGVTVAGQLNGNPGSTLQSLSSPVGLFIDQNNSLFIADRDNNRIVKYNATASTGILVADQSSVHKLKAPRDVAVDRYGFIIVVDTGNNRILNFSNRSHSTVVFQNSAQFSLGEVFDIHIDMDNSVYVIDADNCRILKVMPNGTAKIILPNQGGPGPFSRPHGHFIDRNHTWYIADTSNHRIQMWPAKATSGITIAGMNGASGHGSFNLNTPFAVIVDDNGNIYVADAGNGRVMRWTRNSTSGGTCIVGCTGSSGRAASGVTRISSWGGLSPAQNRAETGPAGSDRTTQGRYPAVQNS